MKKIEKIKLSGEIIESKEMKKVTGGTMSNLYCCAAVGGYPVNRCYTYKSECQWECSNIPGHYCPYQ